MFATLVPENGEREHIITDKLEGRWWEVACGHNHFLVEDFPPEELNIYEGLVRSETPIDKSFCKNCSERLGPSGGLVFIMEGAKWDSMT